MRRATATRRTRGAGPPAPARCRRARQPGPVLKAPAAVPPVRHPPAGRSALLGRAASSAHRTARLPSGGRGVPERHQDRQGALQLPATLAEVLMAVQVLLKAPLTSVPRPNTTPTMTAAMAATMRPYSTAEAPRSRAWRLTLRRYASILGFPFEISVRAKGTS